MLREKTKSILKRHGIRLSKRSGQSQLIDEKVLSRIVEFGSVSKDDVVLEIGPGIGNLTSFLVERAGKVIAVEADERLTRILNERLGERSNLKIINEDILEFSLPEFDKVIANIPYSISSPLTFKLLEGGFDLGVLMYQKEFAQRLIASSGSSDYSRLSVNVAYYAETELLEEVPPDSFLPQPEVWSAIVRLKVRAPLFEVRSKDLFFRTVLATFQHRRQKIRNGLINSFEVVFPDVEFSSDKKRSFIDEAVPNEFSDLRPESISPEEFGKISDSLDKKFQEFME